MNNAVWLPLHGISESALSRGGDDRSSLGDSIGKSDTNIYSSFAWTRIMFSSLQGCFGFNTSLNVQYVDSGNKMVLRIAN